MKTQNQQLEDIVGELHNKLFVRTQHYYEVITSEEMEDMFQECAEAFEEDVFTSDLLKFPDILNLAVLLDIKNELTAWKKSQTTISQRVGEPTKTQLAKDDFLLEAHNDALAFFMVQLVKVLVISTSMKEIPEALADKLEAVGGWDKRTLSPNIIKILEEVSPKITKGVN